MKSIVIHQPYFLPWLGYFSKLVHASELVLLDDALFRKRHFIDRTRYLDTHGEVRWLSLPTGQNVGHRISSVKFEGAEFAVDAGRTLQQSYARAKQFPRTAPGLMDVVSRAIALGSLLETDRLIIEHLSATFELDVLFVLSSSINSKALDATERLIEICQSRGAQQMIVGEGRSLSVHNISAIQNAGIEVRVQVVRTDGIEYPQLRRTRAGFAGGLTVLDGIFNVGIAPISDIMRSKELEPISLERYTHYKEKLR